MASGADRKTTAPPREIGMQVQDEEKRLKILTAAAELFAAQPFHKVCLSDVAEAAAVGKGTLYTYFNNNDPGPDRHADHSGAGTV